MGLQIKDMDTSVATTFVVAYGLGLAGGVALGLSEAVSGGVVAPVVAVVAAIGLGLVQMWWEKRS